MTLVHIAVFALLGLGLSWPLRGRGRTWALLATSVAAVFWLQPSTPIRHLDFWLPVATLGLTVMAWAATRAPGHGFGRDDRIAAGLIAAVVAAVSLTRYAAPLCCYLTTSRPPDIWLAGAALAAIALLAWAAWQGAYLRAAVAVLVLALLISLKTEPLAAGLAGLLRRAAGQSAELALAGDLGWLGFSYVAFRLIHTTRDRATGRLPDLDLREYVTFVVFFPALTAGPIDRAERFVKDLRAPALNSSADIAEGGRRMAIGLFKKFVLADLLALMALSPATAAQSHSTVWTWVMLYAYAVRIYLDFGGYTDLAIGLARLAGVRLPENFDRPYLKPNLTAFWNGWHITLAQWFRAYYFNPLTRGLRTRRLPPAFIILAAQFTTMLLIGLWHGVTWNFLIWGAWHGAGLFVHNRWLDLARPRLGWIEARPGLSQLSQALGVLVTFHYVTLGWVWFALPDPALSWRVLRLLFGGG